MNERGSHLTTLFLCTQTNTQILTQIKLIKVTAPSGVTTVPLNVAAFTSIEAQLQTILNTKIKLS